MNRTSHDERRRLQALDRTALEAWQLRHLNRLLDAILPQNRFYAQKLSGVRRPVASLAELADWPTTCKDDLLPRPGETFAANQTFSRSAYCRLHQTSGTRGRPLLILDTAEDWQWFCDVWQYVLDAAVVQPHDVAFMAFSFGPFIAFWSAHAALTERGCLIVPGGGLSTLGRLELLRASAATLVFCTPTYALHMAEVAQQHGIDLRSTTIRCLILAGEPGGSIPAVRQRLAATWNAQVLDHCGATEVGPWGVGDAAGQGVRITESEFIAEYLRLDGSGPAAPGELSELVLTNFGRAGCPVIRYRTGDLVRPVFEATSENRFVMLAGGVLGRVDDMLIIRGVNLFPSAIEQVLRGFAELGEFRITASKLAEMDQLSIEIEDPLNQPQRVADELRARLSLRIDVRSVPAGSLPRFEGKGKRFIDQRGGSQ